METLDQIITKVSPFADRVEGDKFMFVAEGKVILTFTLVNTRGWTLVPSLETRWVHSEGPERDAILRAKRFSQRFQREVS